MRDAVFILRRVFIGERKDMKQFTKIIAFLVLTIGIAGCGNCHWFCRHKQLVPTEITLGGGRTMLSAYNFEVSDAQLDSICRADSLSPDFNDWMSTYYIDFETKDTVYKHTFIKSTVYDAEIVYVVTEWLDSLVIMKRITNKRR